RAVESRRPHEPIHGPTDSNFQLDNAAPGRIQAPGGSGDYRSAGTPADHERFCDLDPQPIPAKVVRENGAGMEAGGTTMESQTRSEAEGHPEKRLSAPV